MYRQLPVRVYASRNMDRITSKWLLLIVVCPLLAVSAFAKHETGFLDRVVTVNGESYRYQVFVPSMWVGRKKWPVILFLHGAGERGSDGLLQTDVGLPHAIREHAADAAYIAVIPQCRSDKWWADANQQAPALAALEASIKEFKGDRERVYLTGLSMGGYGTWDLAAKFPHRFAAYVVICGGIRGPREGSPLHVNLVDDPKIADPYTETARLVGSTPVWIFHGDVDEAVPVEESRKMRDALEAAKANFKYTEYAGVGHQSWDKAYAEPELMPWLLAKHLQH